MEKFCVSCDCSQNSSSVLELKLFAKHKVLFFFSAAEKKTILNKWLCVNSLESTASYHLIKSHCQFWKPYLQNDLETSALQEQVQE